MVIRIDGDAEPSAQADLGREQVKPARPDRTARRAIFAVRMFPTADKYAPWIRYLYTITF